MADWSDKIGGAFKSFNVIGAGDSSIKNRGSSKPDHSLKLISEGSSTKCSSAGGSSDSSKSNSEMTLEGGSTTICVCWGGNLYIGADTRLCTQEAKSVANPTPEIKISREDQLKVGRIGHAIATMCGDHGECEKIWSKMRDYVRANPQEKSVHSIAYAGYESIMKVNPGDSVMFIAAVENGKAIALRLDNDDIGDYHRKRLASVKETVNVVGTGSDYALKELSGKVFSKMSEEEAIKCIQKALLAAALGDQWTGGKLTVVNWDDGRQEYVMTSLSTMEAYEDLFNDLPFEKSCSLFILYDEHTVKDSNIQSIPNVIDHGAIITQSTCGLMVRRIAFKNGRSKRKFFARATHIRSFPESFLNEEGNLEDQYLCLEEARIMRIQRKLIFVVKPSDQFLSHLETTDVTSPTNFPMKLFSKYCKNH